MIGALSYFSGTPSKIVVIHHLIHEIVVLFKYLKAKDLGIWWWAILHSMKNEKNETSSCPNERFKFFCRFQQ